MPKVHKIIIGISAFMANGGLITFSGAFPIALSAKKFSKKFIV